MSTHDPTISEPSSVPFYRGLEMTRAKKFERKAQSQRKHGPLSVSSASKAPLSPPSTQPGWEGPGYVKKLAKQPPPTMPHGPVSANLEQFLPFELQQLLLDIFRDTFPACIDFEALKPTLQEIKDALLEEDFKRAFGKEEFLEAYTVRWSPSRALAYSNILVSVCEERRGETWIKQLLSDNTERTAKVVCFGGSAADLMSFAGLLRHFHSKAAGKPNTLLSGRPQDVSADLGPFTISSPTPTFINLHLVDRIDWSSVISKLQTRLSTRPTLSKYASAAARALNASVLSTESLKATFISANILNCGIKELCSIIGPSPALLTLNLTLNDLYKASVPKTTTFLLRLTTVAPAGSLLLVVDSPGAYTEAVIGSTKNAEEKRKYPMQYLMDHVLLPRKCSEKGNQEDLEPPRWEKLVSKDSLWYQLEEGLRYPISLENVRFQVHLFKRL